jgi:3-methyladenine DNA glycosylase/8-oxoguanine DNA glycosylase
VADGKLDLDALERLPDDEVREKLIAERGLGPWSAEYILVRGLARSDRVPHDDLGVRSVAGKWLGKGERMTPSEVEDALRPFAPYRGLAAWYLIVANQLM